MNIEDRLLCLLGSRRERPRFSAARVHHRDTPPFKLGGECLRGLMQAMTAHRHLKEAVPMD